MDVPLSFYFIIVVLVIHYITKQITRQIFPAPSTSNLPVMINRRGGRIVPRLHGRGGLLGRPRIPVPVIDDKSVEEEQLSSNSAAAGSEEFEPDLDDVLAVKDLLKRAGNLPDEIALIILDSAEYWACSSMTIDYTNLPQRHLLIRGGSNENQFLVRSEPLGLTSWLPDDQEAWRLQASPQQLKQECPRAKLEQYVDKRLESVLENPCRKIVFKIQSNDQGWGGNRADRGTFKGSWTWFDAGLERFEFNAEATDDTEASQSSAIPVSALRPLWPPVIKDGSDSNIYDHGLHAPPDHKIQCNKTATRETQDHVVEWRYTDDIDPEFSAADELEAAGRGRATGNGEFVRSLRLGDVVTIWGRARFGGWHNQIKKVELKLYWKAV